MRYSPFRSLLIKLGIYFCLTALPLLTGKFVLPIEFYAGSCREVLVNKAPCQKPGRHKPFFYPNEFCHRVEDGDLAMGTRYSIKQDVRWHTDDLGFRNVNYSPDKHYDLVIIGDSDVLGSHTTQGETLVDILSKDLNINVYAWGPDNLNGFMRSKRFQKDPPSIVIMAENERNAGMWPMVRTFYGAYPLILRQLAENEKNKETILGCRIFSALPGRWQQYVDKVLQKPLLTTHLLTMIQRRVTGVGRKEGVLNKQGNMFFYEPSFTAFRKYQSNPILLAETTQALLFYYQEMAKRNILLIYMPVPSKASIYWDVAPDNLKAGLVKPYYISTTVQAIRLMGLPAIDLTRALRTAAAEKGKPLHHFDDRHWTKEGIRVAAEAIKKEIAARILL